VESNLITKVKTVMRKISSTVIIKCACKNHQDSVNLVGYVPLSKFSLQSCTETASCGLTTGTEEGEKQELFALALIKESSLILMSCSSERTVHAS